MLWNLADHKELIAEMNHRFSSSLQLIMPYENTLF